MDPFRGFPQFIRALPEIISKNDELKVEIAGNPTVFYGSMPNNFNSWKSWAIDYLKKHKVEHKISWRGFMDSEEYLKWLQSSWCHVYLTHPFVASWSMVEALACGMHLIASDVEATHEFCQNIEGVSMVDHRDTTQIVQQVAQYFKSSSKIRYYDRHVKLEHFSRTASISNWFKIIEKVHTMH